MTAAGVERAIPVSFYKMYAGNDWWGNGDAVLYEDARRAIDRANEIYKGTGVQFFMKKLKDCSALPGFLGTYATRQPGDIPYSAARPDLNNCLFPLPASAPPPLDSEWHDRDYWTDWGTLKYGPKTEITVFVHRWDSVTRLANYGAPFRGPPVIHLVGLTDRTSDWRSVFAHEAAHVLMGIATVKLPEFRDELDPSTGQNFKLSSFWDLVYAPGGGLHTFFHSEVDAQGREADLLPIHTNMLVCNGPPAAGQCCVGAHGNLTCLVGQVGGYTETHTYPSGLTEEPLKGMAFTFATADAPPASYRWGINPFSELDYRGFPESLTDSQVQTIQKYLRYETRVREENPNFTDYYCSPDCTGSRPQLGQWVAQEPAFRLDFDNDGLRDIGWWQPPASALLTGTFRVLLSSYGYSTAPLQSLTVQLGRLGDTPAPADYDGDGRTDIAVYQGGGGPNGDQPWVEQSYWRWCRSSDFANVLNTNNCGVAGQPQPLSLAAGLRDAVPLPGLDFDGNPATGEVALYYPSTGYFAWMLVSNPVPTTKYLGGSAFPLPGLYDADKKTDLVVYYPQWGEFRMKLSGDNWTAETIRTFPSTVIPNGLGTTPAQLSGAVPIRGMYTRLRDGTYYWCGFQFCKSYVPRLALSLWSPDDGKWYVNWNPVSGTARTDCVYGQSGMKPVSSLGTDFLHLKSTPDYSRMAYYKSTTNTPSGGYGSLLQKDSVLGSCTGTVHTARIYIPSYPRTMAYSVSDMTGDGLPELFLVQPESMVGRWYSSETDYNSTSGTTVQMGDQKAVVL